jgi:hypothetical protein
MGPASADSGTLLIVTVVHAENPDEVHLVQRMRLSVRRMIPIASLLLHVDAMLGMSALASLEYDVVLHCGDVEDTNVPRMPVVPEPSTIMGGHAGQSAVPQLPAVPGAGHDTTHIPEPLHSPSVHSLSGSIPLAMKPQVPEVPWPFFAAEHAMQLLVQPLSQQTPSTQKPDWHWLPSVQDVPLGSG